MFFDINKNILNFIGGLQVDILFIMKEEDNMDWLDSDDEMKYVDLLSLDNEVYLVVYKISL